MANTEKRMSQLPRHSEVIEVPLFHRVRDLILATGTHNEVGISLKRRGIEIIVFPDGDENAECILTMGTVSGIGRCYICADAKEHAGEAFVDVVAQNIISFLTSFVPRRYHNELVREVVSVAGLLSIEEKELAWKTAKKGLKESNTVTNVVDFQGFLHSRARV
jgi:hypothetical protein